MSDMHLTRGVKLRDLKKQMVFILTSFGIEKGEASVEAEMIVEHVSGMNRSQQLVCADIPVTDRQTAKMERYILQRQARMPIQYCLEVADFAGFKFKVKQGVFIPRTDTETLLEEALRLCGKLGDRPVIKVLEVGVGSGALSVSLLKKMPRTRLTGTDISEDALSVTLENARQHKVLKRINLKHEGLWWLLDERFDLVICNPPYIPLSEKESLEPEVVEYEPHEALFGRDPDGLRFYRKLSTTIPKMIDLAGGYMAVEVGDKQADKVQEVFKEAGWGSLNCQRDVNGISRVVSGSWMKK